MKKLIKRLKSRFSRKPKFKYPEFKRVYEVYPNIDNSGFSRETMELIEKNLKLSDQLKKLINKIKNKNQWNT